MNKLAFVALFAAALPASAQDGKKWKPYQFAGNERFEYKTVMVENDEKKESGYILDLRKKGDEDFEVTWSTRGLVKKSQGAEILMGGMGTGMATAMVLMNPVYSIFFNDLELKEGEKLSMLGFGVIKVTAKEKVGGRTGFTCKLFAKQDDKEVVAQEWTIDPELGLPLRSVMFENGVEKMRFELLSYKRD